MTHRRTQKKSPAVIMEGVLRSFGANEVLRGVAGIVAPGKVVGLLGRNGSGKTTLLRILLDMLAADAGRIEVLGRTPDGSGEIRQLAGYVPERPSFHDFMTVGEVLDLRACFFRHWDRRRAGELAGRMKLDPQTRIRGASKGTLGKLAWVCATAHDPELYLLDEPTSGLDALVREDVLNHLIEELHGTGKTILIASHRLEEVAGLLDEVWVLAGGRIAAVHDAEALRTEACRITGRLKTGAKLPSGMPVVDLSAVGPLVEWAVFESGAAEIIASSGLLENMDRSALSIEDSLRLLLQVKGGENHD